jgi:hypothetical protein
MRWLLGQTLWLFVCLICPQALAWDYVEVDDGDSSLFPPIVPVGSSIRNWGPADKVLILTETKWEETTTDDTHTITLYGFTCSNNNGCATVTNGPILQPLEFLRFDTPFLPSLAISRQSANDPIVLSAVMRQKIETDCDGDNTEYDELLSSEDQDPDALNRDLGEIVFEWDTWLAFAGTHDVAVSPPAICRDHGVSFTRMTNGFPASCWTQISGSSAKYVHCSQRTALFSWQAAGSPTELYGQDINAPGIENPWFDFRNGTTKLIAVHNTTDTKTQVYVNGNTSYADFLPTNDEPNWPTIDIEGAGAVHLAWADTELYPGTGTAIEYSRCPSTEDCADETDWVSGHEDAPNDDRHEVIEFDGEAGHPQLAVDGKKQFLLVMADRPEQGLSYGVYLLERCGDDEWTSELVKTPLSSGFNQRIDNGVPNIVLNQQEHIVHVVFVENITTFDFITEGHVFWARKSYTPCP